MTRCRAGVRRRSRMIPGPFPRAIRHRRAIRCRRVSSRPFRSLGSTRRVRQPRLQRHLAHRVRQLPSTRARSIRAPGIIRQGAYHGRCRGSRGSALSLARQFRNLARTARRRVPREPPIPGDPASRHQAYASGPGARPALAPGDPASRHHARRARPGDRRNRGGAPVARRGPGRRGRNHDTGLNQRRPRGERRGLPPDGPPVPARPRAPARAAGAGTAPGPPPRPVPGRWPPGPEPAPGSGPGSCAPSCRGLTASPGKRPGTPPAA